MSKVYPNLSQYRQDVLDMKDNYKIPSGSRSGPSPGPRGSQAGVCGPCAWAGPAAAWYFVFILYIWEISWMYLDISEYICVEYTCWYFSGIFCAYGKFVFAKQNAKALRAKTSHACGPLLTIEWSVGNAHRCVVLQFGQCKNLNEFNDRLS